MLCLTILQHEIIEYWNSQILCGKYVQNNMETDGAIVDDVQTLVWNTLKSEISEPSLISNLINNNRVINNNNNSAEQNKICSSR